MVVRQDGRKVATKRKERVSHENKNKAGRSYVTTKRIRRGEKDTMEAIIVGYERTMARRCVRNVRRLHQRWKVLMTPSVKVAEIEWLRERKGLSTLAWNAACPL